MNTEFKRKHYDTVRDQNIAMLISGFVIAVLNLISWMGISAEKYSAQIAE